MSLSCHNRISRAAALCALLGAVAFAPALSAQQTYFIPTFEASARYDTNLEMVTDPALEDPTVGYRALMAARIGWQSPRALTEIRPRVLLQEFPDRQGIDPVDLFFDLRTEFNTQLSEFSLLARYARQDTYHAEFNDAPFDDFDPQNPDASDTGIVYQGDTRTRIEVDPYYSYAVSERTRIGALAQVQNVDFSSNQPGGLIGYDYGYAELFLEQKLTQLIDLRVGPYAGRFESDNGNVTDSYGATIEFTYRWSEITYAGLSLQGERDDITHPQSVPAEQTVTNWGLEFFGVRSSPIGHLRYSIGHFIDPSSVGSLIESNQMRVEYKQLLSPRFSFTGAVFVKQQNAVGNQQGNDFDLFRVDLELEWMMTRTWYISGGYRYAWQELQDSNTDADDNRVFIAVGYRGLGQRNR